MKQRDKQTRVELIHSLIWHRLDTQLLNEITLLIIPTNTYLTFCTFERFISDSTVHTSELFFISLKKLTSANQWNFLVNFLSVTMSKVRNCFLKAIFHIGCNNFSLT